MVIKGEVAKVRVGYQVAAEISGWSLTRDTETLNQTESSFTGTIKFSDSYWIDQNPMKLGLWMGGVWWVWYRFHLETVEGSTIRATVVGNPVIMQDFR